MTNQQAPYNNTETMISINRWYKAAYPKHTTPKQTHIIELYESYQVNQPTNKPTSDKYLTPNQFAKCLVAARIADLGNGTWTILPNWEPKAYEIARAKVY